MGAVSSVVETVADTATSAVEDVVETVSDVGSEIDDAVNDVVPGGWATVANVAVPGSGAVIAAAKTLDEGGSIEDALTNAAVQYAVGEAIKGFGTDTTGLDMGETIPTTPAQTEGLYPSGGTFNPPVIDTTGLDMGDVIPTTQTPVQSPFNTLPITAQDPFAFTEPELTQPSNTLPISTQDPFGYTPPMNITPKDVLNVANLAMTANSLINPPELPQVTTSGYELQPIPETWKSPVYQQEFTPIDLNTIFGNQNLLANTQWATQPQQVQFAQAPTMQNLTDIISGINFGQNAVSDQSVKG